jgi:hypothetical protein
MTVNKENKGKEYQCGSRKKSCLNIYNWTDKFFVTVLNFEYGQYDRKEVYNFLFSFTSFMRASFLT